MLQEVETTRRHLPNRLKIAITFCLLSSSTCACVEYFGRALETLIKKVTVCCIHGKMKDKRNKIFADFRALKRWRFGLNGFCRIPIVKTTQFVSQWDPGVHRCDGQRHRHTWCWLGAAVRSSEQCQVSDNPRFYGYTPQLWRPSTFKHPQFLFLSVPSFIDVDVQHASVTRVMLSSFYSPWRNLTSIFCPLTRKWVFCGIYLDLLSLSDYWSFIFLILSLSFSALSRRCLRLMTWWTCCIKSRPCLWLIGPYLTEAWEPSSHTCRHMQNTSVVSSSESKVNSPVKSGF